MDPFLLNMHKFDFCVFQMQLVIALLHLCCTCCQILSIQKKNSREFIWLCQRYMCVVEIFHCCPQKCGSSAQDDKLGGWGGAVRDCILVASMPRELWTSVTRALPTWASFLAGLMMPAVMRAFAHLGPAAAPGSRRPAPGGSGGDTCARTRYT